MKRQFLFILFVFFFTACSLGSYQPGTLQLTQSRSLSLYDPELRTCVFDPFYSIVHFPMYHEAPTQENFSIETYELVAKSQFQLMHTLIDYQRALQFNLAVFDEHITSDGYNSNYMHSLQRGLAGGDTYTKMNGQTYYYSERYRLAQNLFGNGFPSHYEYLNELQKKFLYETGASVTLYLLQEIPQIYKVISKTQWQVVKANLTGKFFSAVEGNPNYYWIFTFREMELRREINKFYQRRPSYAGLVFIAYGASHDFSDDFAGLSFQSGHDFCLKWTSTSSVLP